MKCEECGDPVTEEKICHCCGNVYCDDCLARIPCCSRCDPSGKQSPIHLTARARSEIAEVAMDYCLAKAHLFDVAGNGAGPGSDEWLDCWRRCSEIGEDLYLLCEKHAGKGKP